MREYLLWLTEQSTDCNHFYWKSNFEPSDAVRSWSIDSFASLYPLNDESMKTL